MTAPRCAAEAFSVRPIDRLTHEAYHVPQEIAGLLAARDRRIPFHDTLSRSNAKEVAGLQARAALAGFVLARFEDDGGHEAFVAVRGAETVRLETRAAVEAWLARGPHG